MRTIIIALSAAALLTSCVPEKQEELIAGKPERIQIIPAKETETEQLIVYQDNSVRAEITGEDSRRHAVIEVYTGPDCVQCERWKEYIPQLTRIGWRVEERPATVYPVPNFRVWMLGKRSNRITGFMSFSRLRAAMRGLSSPAVEYQQTYRTTLPGR